MGPGAKLKLIMWKNYLMRRRRWLMAMFEIAFPSLLFLILVGAKTEMPVLTPKHVDKPHKFPVAPFPTTSTHIYYAPENTQTTKMMETVTAATTTRGFKTITAMMKHLAEERKGKGEHYPIAVVFDNVDSDKLPKNLEYKIRGDTPPFNIMDLYSVHPPYKAKDYLYYTRSFLLIQKSIDEAFIREHKSVEFEITSQRTSIPPHLESDSAVDVLWIGIACFTVLSFTPFLFNTIRRILEEKASGIKELMKMVGLQTWIVWLGWYIYCMLVIVIVVLMITLFMKLTIDSKDEALISSGDGSLFYIFLLVYCIAMVSFCILIATIFSSPIFGAVMGVLIWAVTIIPIIIIERTFEETSFSIFRFLLLLFPNTCLYYGYKNIMYYEKEAPIGIQWWNFFSVPGNYHYHFCIAVLLLILLLDTCLFLTLTWYIDNVHPGEFGVAKRWDFCISDGDEDLKSAEDEAYVTDNIEPPSSDLQPGIQIRNLRKDFKKKSAINGLTIDIYANQTTVLLGHTGSGKTTIMNIVNGTVPPTSGHIFISGYNLETNKEMLRKSLGLCPQNDVYFPDLTVLEHFTFFTMLKGRSMTYAKREGNDYLVSLNMTEDAEVQAEYLSIGMKRRLSLGLALVGNTKVLMLDEPTFGMDPDSRKEIWEILVNLRGTRTILISTQYMEEADTLADRIAIMHGGQLMCYGSPAYLKKLYGTGYILTVNVNKNVDISKIGNFIRTYIPNAKVQKVTRNSVNYELPSEDTRVLSQLFVHIERNKADLGIISLGITIKTMDDVFFKVGKIAAEDKKTTKTEETEEQFFDDHLYNTGNDLHCQQFHALGRKRYLYHRATWMIFLFAMIAPIVLILLAILFAPGVARHRDRVLDLSIYPHARSYYSSDKGSAALASYYEKTVEQKKGQAVATKKVPPELAKQAKENILYYYSKLVTAAEIESAGGKITVNIMYGTCPLHGLPISMNLMSNALLKSALNNTESYIRVANSPLFENIQTESVIWMMVFWITLLSLGLYIFMALLLSFHASEYASGVKHLQVMAGVSRLVYWFNNYLIDMILYICVLIVTIILIFIFNHYFLSSLKVIVYFTMLMLLFGAAGFPFCYFFHYRSTPGNLAGILIFPVLIFGIIMPIVIFYFEYSNFISREPVEDNKPREIITLVCMAVPHFAFSMGLQRLYVKAEATSVWEKHNEQNIINMCSEYPPHPCCPPVNKKCDELNSYFSGDLSLTVPVVFLLVEAILYMLIFLLLDYGYFKIVGENLLDLVRIVKEGGGSIDDIEIIDSDVLEEQRRVKVHLEKMRDASWTDIDPDDALWPPTPSSDGTLMVVSNLHKNFGFFHAVNGITFAVNERECFGLLGINSSGKTTTFKMLTGEIWPSNGLATILNYSIYKNKQMYLKQIGYCPQFDAFNGELTTIQMLTVIAHLRGIPETQVKRHVYYWLSKSDLMQYQDIQCGKLNSGNKRKLSTAMALISQPTIVMLDEPTREVDPMARRNMWTIISSMKKGGQTLVITSESMDECEALCDRVAIMIDGQFKCIGSVQYLKDKFSQAFTLIIKLKNVADVNEETETYEVQLQNLKNRIKRKYNCVLKDEQLRMLTYHVTDNYATVSRMFVFMNRVKRKRPVVEDFIVSNPSLEQLFLVFEKERDAAKMKKEMEKKRKKSKNELDREDKDKSVSDIV